MRHGLLYACMSRRNVTISILVALALLGQARPARAWSCDRGPSTVPASGERIPRDGKIWISKHLARSLWWRLLRSRGIDIRALPVAEREPTTTGLASELVLLRDGLPTGPFELVELHLGLLEFFVLLPRGGLNPGTHVLELRDSSPSNPAAWRSVVLEFAVEDEWLKRPPAAPRASIQRWHRAGVAPFGGTRVSMTIDSSGPFVAHEIFAARSGAEPARTTLGYHASNNARSLVVGGGPCGIGFSFFEGPAMIRLGTVDIAGKFSGWGDPILLQPPWKPERTFQSRLRSPPALVPPPRGCGCEFPRRDELTAAPLLALGVLLASVRCRRRRSSTGGRFPPRPRQTSSSQRHDEPPRPAASPRC